jgi:ABC-type thiamin/hydroxymethylpyrimidine transport system permease subunit
MVTLLRRSLIAWLFGAALAWAVPVVTALVAAAPGLATLSHSIKAAALPLQPVYFGLTNFLPALMLSFGVGFAMFRILGGRRRSLLVASAAPWLLNALYFYIELCVGTSVSCTGAFELAGLAVVPLGLLLAALASKPPSLNMSIDTDPQQQEAASPRVLVVRSFLRYVS